MSNKSNEVWGYVVFHVIYKKNKYFKEFSFVSQFDYELGSLPVSEPIICPWLFLSLIDSLSAANKKEAFIVAYSHTRLSFYT